MYIDNLQYSGDEPRRRIIDLVLRVPEYRKAIHAATKIHMHSQKRGQNFCSHTTGSTTSLVTPSCNRAPVNQKHIKHLCICASAHLFTRMHPICKHLLTDRSSP